MKCPCCGYEVSANDRFCPNCGENNESYVEHNVQVTPSYSRPANTQINQPINRVSIYPQNNNNSYNNNSNSGVNHNNNNNQSNQSQVYLYNQEQYITKKEESKTIGILAIVFSVLGGWLGLILSIIGLCTYKEPENRKLCKIGVGFIIGWFIVGIIIGLSL